MELRTCHQCHRIFNSTSGGSTCPKCFTLIESKFKEVKQFIRENPESSIVKVSQACNVTIEQVRDWIKDERIEYKKGSQLGIECEHCGITILTGRYCDKCKNEFASGMKKIYNTIEENHLQVKKKNDNETKLKYLSKDINRPFR